MKTTVNINWTEIKDQLDSAKHGQKSMILNRLNEAYGLSKDQIYRQLRRLRGRKKVVEREPKYDQKVIQIFMEAKIRGEQATDAERNIATEEIRKEFIRQGIVSEAECPSVSTINRLMRERYGFKQKRPKVQWKCDYALQDLQIDFSQSKSFRIVEFDKQKNDYLLKASPRVLSYRRNPDKAKVILAGFHDKYSGLSIIQASAGAAESYPILIEGMRFWLLRPEDDHLMRHLPFGIGHDNGSLFKGEEYRNLCTVLDYNDRSSRPYQKTGIGAVERKWRALWNKEILMSFSYENIYLSEYNELIHQAMVEDHQKMHPWRNEPKGDVYQQSILQRRPEILEDDILEFSFRSYERTVTESLTVSVDAHVLQVPQYTEENIPLIGKRVKVFKNRKNEYVAQLVDQFSEPFKLSDYERHSMGEYRSYKETTKERMEKENRDGNWVHKQLAEQKRQELSDQAQPKRLTPKASPKIIESPFTPTPTVEVEDTFDTAMEAKLFIAKQLKPLGITYPEVQAFFDAEIASNLSKSHIRDLLTTFKTAFRQTGT